MSKEKKLRITILNEDGTPNKSFLDEANKVAKMTDNERSKYYSEKSSKLIFNSDGKNRLLDWNLFEQIILKFFILKLYNENINFDNLSLDEQLVYVAKGIRQLEINEFTKQHFPELNKLEKEKRNLYSDWINSQKNYLSLIASLKEHKKENKPKDQHQKTTYKWQGNAEIELQELHSLMINNKYKLIASDTTLERFKAIFSGQTIDDKIEPIEWLNKPVLLAYFIMQLVKNNKILEIDIWAKAENCFKDINRKSLAQSYQNSLDNKTPKHKGKPKDFKIIESLFQ